MAKLRLRQRLGPLRPVCALKWHTGMSGKGGEEKTPGAGCYGGLRPGRDR